MIKLTKSTFFNEKETKRKLCEFISKAEVLSMDTECKKFEEKFSKVQNREFSVFVNSGSGANLILLQSLLNLGRLKKGDRVGVSALTWATNVMPIIELGLIPAGIDCEISTLNISPGIIEPILGGLQALFITNVLGFADNIEKLRQMCEEKNILFLEDNCESLGSKAYGKLLGNFGLASTFSFFVGHHFSTIEGGMVCTDDEELYEALLICRAHGWDRNLSIERKELLRGKYEVDPFFGKFTFYDLAYNVRPTEINGFLGNLQIDYLDEMIARREKNFAKFQLSKSNNIDILPLEVGHMEINSNFNMPLVFKDYQTFLKYKEKFDKADVEIRPIIAGDITKQPFWRKYMRNTQDYPNSQIIHYKGFYFPNNPELTDEEVKLLSSLIRADNV